MRARTYVTAALATIAITITGCSKSSTSNGATATVEGFVKAVQQHDTKAACSHYQPSVQAQCEKNLPKDSQVTGFKVGDSIVDGDRAIVVIEADKLCLGGTCLTNHDAHKDLPSKSGFDAAYKKVQSGSNTDPRVPCIKVNGTWYINPSS